MKLKTIFDGVAVFGWVGGKIAERAFINGSDWFAFMGHDAGRFTRFHMASFFGAYGCAVLSQIELNFLTEKLPDKAREHYKKNDVEYITLTTAIGLTSFKLMQNASYHRGFDYTDMGFYAIALGIYVAVANRERRLNNPVPVPCAKSNHHIV